MDGLGARLARAVARGFGSWAAHLFPAGCFGCGRPLGRSHLAGACPSCWSSLVPLRAGCSSCGLPTGGIGPQALATRYCARCARRPWPTDGVTAAVAYEGFARTALLRAKMRGRPELFRPLGEQLAAVVALLPAAGVVVPVPSHPWTRFRRGFDPAAALAKIVAARNGLAYRPDLLRASSSRRTPSKRLPARDRKAGSASRFLPAGSAARLHVLLVDDVMTTGATALACDAALRHAGAVSVRIAVWARTPEPAL